MKKLLAVLLCLIMLLSLPACESPESENDLPAASETDASDDGGADTTEETTEETTEDKTEDDVSNDPIVQIYEAAIRGEICVFDEALGEVKLQDCRFPSNGVKFGECEILVKVILDMDGDGESEYVIGSPSKDHIVLHHDSGKVYSYAFDRLSFYNLNTDGSFYWTDCEDTSDCTRGQGRMVFDGASMCIREVYRIKQTSPYDYGDGDHEYFVDDTQVTREEFRDYYLSDLIGQRKALFTPLDPSCAYPITSAQAFEIASNYWDIRSGMTEGAAGTMIISKIVILEMPNNDTLSYHVGWEMEGYRNHVIDDPLAQLPSSSSIYKELLIDAVTGACEAVELGKEPNDGEEGPLQSELAMEMYDAVLKNEMKVYETDIEEYHYLKDCKTPYDRILLSDCGYLQYAYTDMDDDGVNELVLDCCDDVLILRYYKGRVYVYSFTFRNMYYLNTDGSYSWNHTGQDFAYGESRIYFKGAELKTRELYRIVNDGEPDAQYYVCGEQVTQNALLQYIEDHPRNKVVFSELEVSWQSKISQAQAIELAKKYWEHFDIEENRYIVMLVAQDQRAPSSVYVAVIKEYVMNHYSTFDEIWIDKNTGEAIIPYSTDGK